MARIKFLFSVLHTTLHNVTTCAIICVTC